MTGAQGGSEGGWGPPRVRGFTVGRRCGQGSSAMVFVARRDRDGQPCALKVERAPGGDPEAFEREAEVLSRVRASGLIRLHERTRAADGRRVLVLDLCGGGTVRDLIAARGHLLVREAAGVLRRAATALAALHDQGFLHGDVCAGNVLVSRQGTAVLADLGGARVPGVPAAAYGTEGYLAPELTWGADPTPAADIYALGALGWAMLTGVVPDDLPPEGAPLEDVPDCPAPLREAILRCLASDPAQRPGAVELLGLLEVVGAEERLALPDAPGLGGAVTYRLRGADEAAGGDGTRCPEDGGFAGVARGAVGRHRPGAARGDTPPRALRVLAALTGPRARAGLALALGLCAGVGCWAGIAAWRDTRAVVARPAPSAPGDARGVTPRPRLLDSITNNHEAATTASRAGAPGTATQAPVEPRPEEIAPQEAFAELLRRRAAAYAQADPALLDDVYLAASPVHAQAVADVGRLRREGLRYEGLAYAVRRVTDETDGPSEQADEARLLAVVDTGRYRARDGVMATDVPGRKGAPTRVTLRRVGDGWRIASIEAVRGG